MKVIFDVDGCLADFWQGFTTLLHERFQTPVTDTAHGTKWGEFPGVSKVEEWCGWEAVEGSENFWFGLHPLVVPETFGRINRLCREHEVYFITSRPGKTAKQQTEEWLLLHGIERPTVVISSKKGEMARAVGASFSIEDKAENAWCIRWMSPGTVSCLVDRQYNRYDPDAFGSHQVRRVASIEEFLDIVEEADANA